MNEYWTCLGLLLIAFFLCSFVSRFTKEGMETYYASNGASARVETDASGNTTVVITDASGNSTVYTTANGGSTYVGPDGGTATTNGTTIVVTQPDGTVVTYNTNTGTGTSNTNTNTNTGTTTATNTNYDNYNHYNQTSYPTILYGPDGGTARIYENGSVVITSKNGTTEIYYVDKNNPSAAIYYGPNGGTAKIVKDGNGNYTVQLTYPDGTQVTYTGNQYTDQYNNSEIYAVNTTTTSADYYTSLPPGIPRSQIPAGDEDLYILKSQVVPPVCPACPQPIINTNSDDVTKCPPCPPCARCPEPAFDCKKVPNYNAFNPDYMPMPVLNSFSTFGM